MKKVIFLLMTNIRFFCQIVTEGNKKRTDYLYNYLSLFIGRKTTIFYYKAWALTLIQHQ